MCIIIVRYIKKGRDMAITSQPTLRESFSETYLQAVIDGLEDELIVIDRNSRIVQANRAVCLRHNRKRDEIIGQYCYDISHGPPELCQPPRHECPITTVWETGKPARVTHLHIYEVDGVEHKRYLDIIASPIFGLDGTVAYIVELLRDVTEAKLMELKISEAHQNLLALNLIASVVSQSLDLETVLCNALDKTLEMLKADTGGILLWDEDSRTLRYRVHRGLSTGFVSGVSYHPGEGIVGLVAETGQTVMVEDITKDPRAIHPDLIIAEGLKGFIIVPLAIEDRALGVLNVASKDAHRFSSQDIQLLENIASQVAIAIEKARLHQEVQHQDQVRGELLNQVFSIQEEERKRIAQELHDETTQSLAALAANLEATASTLPPGEKHLQAKLKAMQNLAIKIIDDAHQLIYELRPTMLNDLGLVAAVRAHAKQEFKSSTVKLYFSVVGKEKRLSTLLESALFRVVQEAINNIKRHARACHCRIILHFRRDSVVVRVADDGRGFNVAEALSTRDRPRGLGLLGMRERIELVHGNLEIKSQP